MTGDHGRVSAGDTQVRILEAARELIDDRGSPEVAIAEVARASGVSRQTVYLHFGSRAGLLLALARHHDRTSGFMSRVLAARSRPALEGFERLLDAWFDYLPEILPVARALEGAAIAGDEGGDAWHDRMRDWRGAIRIAVEGLAGAGALADGWTVERATDWVWALVHVERWQHLVVECGWPPAEFRDRTLSTLRRDVLRAERDGDAGAEGLRLTATPTRATRP